MNYPLCSLLLATAGALSASDVSGGWEFTAKYLGDVTYAQLTLKAEGEKLTGTLFDLNLTGTLHGDELTLTATRPNGEHFGDFKGAQHGELLDGSAVWTENRQVVWSAKRPPKTPTEALTHVFEPKEFHRVFSDAIPPVLHVFPGDTVKTWTVDAGGVDSKGVTRSRGGNPETGPFYIEGAFPGDTWVVKLNRVRLNRDSARSGDQIVGSALNPG